MCDAGLSFLRDFVMQRGKSMAISKGKAWVDVVADCRGLCDRDDFQEWLEHCDRVYLLHRWFLVVKTAAHWYQSKSSTEGAEIISVLAAMSFQFFGAISTDTVRGSDDEQLFPVVDVESWRSGRSPVKWCLPRDATRTWTMTMRAEEVASFSSGEFSSKHMFDRHDSLPGVRCLDELRGSLLSASSVALAVLSRSLELRHVQCMLSFRDRSEVTGSATKIGEMSDNLRCVLSLVELEPLELCELSDGLMSEEEGRTLTALVSGAVLDRALSRELGSDYVSLDKRSELFVPRRLRWIMMAACRRLALPLSELCARSSELLAYVAASVRDETESENARNVVERWNISVEVSRVMRRLRDACSALVGRARAGDDEFWSLLHLDLAEICHVSGRAGASSVTHILISHVSADLRRRLSRLLRAAHEVWEEHILRRIAMKEDLLPPSCAEGKRIRRTRSAMSAFDLERQRRDWRETDCLGWLLVEAGCAEALRRRLALGALPVDYLTAPEKPFVQQVFDVVAELVHDRLGDVALLTLEEDAEFERMSEHAAERLNVDVRLEVDRELARCIWASLHTARLLIQVNERLAEEEHHVKVLWMAWILEGGDHLSFGSVVKLLRSIENRGGLRAIQRTLLTWRLSVLVLRKVDSILDVCRSLPPCHLRIGDWCQRSPRDVVEFLNAMFLLSGSSGSTRHDLDVGVRHLNDLTCAAMWWLQAAAPVWKDRCLTLSLRRCLMKNLCEALGPGGKAVQSLVEESDTLGAFDKRAI